MEPLITGTYKKYAHYGFFIPTHREDWGGDFYINAKNGKGAEDGAKVKARPMVKTKGKKQEAKIIEIINAPGVKQAVAKDKYIQGVYNSGNGNFGFIDVDGEQKGYFVYGDRKGDAVDGDKVKAKVIIFKGKKEAIELEVIGDNSDIIIGEYKDNGEFGFVFTKKGNDDIFVSKIKSRKAQTGDQVKVRIIKNEGRRPEGIILEVLDKDGKEKEKKPLKIKLKKKISE